MGMIDSNKNNETLQKHKLSLADIIRATAISWATGAFTEKQIRYCLKHEYNLAQNDIDSVLIGCNELQKGIMNSLTDLTKNLKNKEKIINN